MADYRPNRHIRNVKPDAPHTKNLRWFFLIGGKSDGQTTPWRLLELERDGEKYLSIEFKDAEGNKQLLYMRYGMSAAEAIKRWKELKKANEQTHAPNH